MRCPRASAPNRAALCAALLLGVAHPVYAAPIAGAVGPAAIPAPRPVALLLVINGVEAAEPLRVIDTAGHLFADAAALRAAGVDVPARLSGDVALDSLADTQVALDVPAQRLIVTQRRRAAGRNHVVLSDRPLSRPLTRTRSGIALAYDLTAIAGTDSQPALAGFVDTRLFAGGVALASGIVLAPRTGGGTHVVRLDSALTLTDPDRLFRATVGDFIGTSLPWSRAVRLAGIQMGSDFALRPDLVTFPLPAIAGEAAVPSTIDLIAQGGRAIGKADVEPGDYLLSGVPVSNGHGTIGIVVRDASGRESMRTISLYGAPQLLAPGLSELGFDIGAVRRGYGTRSAAYRGFAASASGRKGLSAHLTLEGHGELAEGLTLGGMGAVIGVGTFGVLSVDAAASHARQPGDRADGYQAGMLFERVARPFSFSLTGRYVSDGYRDVASVNGDPPPRSTVAGQLGIDLGRIGTASLGYTRLFGRAGVAGGPPLDTLSLLTASYGATLGSGLNMFASGLIDFADRRSRSLSVGLSMALGGGRSALVGADLRPGQDGVIAEYRDPALTTGDWGYRLGLAHGVANHLVAEGEYRAAPGRLSAAVEQIAGRTSVRIGMRGAVLLVDDGIFFADSLTGGYAILSAGAEGVTVLQEHRPVGRTRRDGRYLVTNLRPYQDNLLAIDPLDLPADARIGDTQMIVRPGETGPVEAGFAVDRRPAATVLLVDGAGQPLAPGGEVTLNGGAAVPIGFGGMAWVEGLARDNSLIVALADGGQCRATVTLAPGRVPPRIGPVACLP